MAICGQLTVTIRCLRARLTRIVINMFVLEWMTLTYLWKVESLKSDWTGHQNWLLLNVVRVRCAWLSALDSPEEQREIYFVLESVGWRYRWRLMNLCVIFKANIDMNRILSRTNSSFIFYLVILYIRGIRELSLTIFRLWFFRVR